MVIVIFLSNDLFIMKELTQIKRQILSQQLNLFQIQNMSFFFLLIYFLLFFDVFVILVVDGVWERLSGRSELSRQHVHPSTPALHASVSGIGALFASGWLDL